MPPMLLLSVSLLEMYKTFTPVWTQFDFYLNTEIAALQDTVSVYPSFSLSVSLSVRCNVMVK